MKRFRVALLAGIAWLAASWPARLSLGWYPPTSAKYFLAFGWVIVLALGIAAAWLRNASRRWTTGIVVVAVGAAGPLLAARYLPGVKQPTEYSIPGHPWIGLSASPDGTSHLFLMRGDALNLVQLAGKPWDGTVGSVALSPERRRLAFRSNRYGTDDLFVMDLDAAGHPTGITRLTQAPGDETDPTWSPDGKRIAFESSDGRFTDIDVIDVSGRTPKMLRRYAGNPAWSPDGHRIAFTAESATNPYNNDIWIMNAEGSHPKDVIDVTSNDWEPRWSPDGTRLAFTGSADGHEHVFVANADGSGIKDITPGSADSNQALGWSPDGSKVLFLSNRSHTGGTFLYLMDPNGNDVQLALRA